jgi:hypothetical protein
MNERTSNTTNIINEYSFNGKKYSSYDDLPEEAKRLIRDENNNNIPDIIENSDNLDNHTVTKIVRKNVVHKTKQNNNISMDPFSDNVTEDNLVPQFKFSNILKVIALIALILALVYYFNFFK